MMLFFVYGTLLSGLERSYVLDDSTFIGAAVAGGVCLYNLGDYPGIKNGNSTVRGELYDVDDITLEEFVRHYNNTPLATFSIANTIFALVSSTTVPLSPKPINLIG